MKELMLAIADGAAAKEGLLWVLVLFLVCFGAVHAARLALLGWRAVKGAPQEKPKAPEQKEAEPEAKPEEPRGKTDETPAPVYLLVEKKRVRKKPKFEEPKRIDLKE